MIASRACALAGAGDERTFGGKAAQLAAAAAAGLPVPPAVALSAELVAAIAATDRGALEELHDAVSSVRAPYAVRSSAIGEDSEQASFAGQHLTVLGVVPERVAAAVRKVFASAGSEVAVAYRRRLGIEEGARTGVLVQQMVAAEVAGVLFTRNPLDGSDERVIEASWGLGEVVVEGVVIPDRYRIAPGGRVLERVAGRKDVAVELLDSGRTIERAVSGDRVESLCLDDGQLAALDVLASDCVRFLGGDRDIEFAFAAGTLHLLQSRPLTR